MRLGRNRGILSVFWKGLLIVLPACLIFAVIWMRSNIVALEYEIGQLEKQRIHLIDEKRDLIAKRAELGSFKRIEYSALNRMGLRYTDRKRVFYIKTIQAPAPFTARFIKDK